MNFRRSIYFRITIVFILLIVAVSALQLVVAARSFTELAATIEQRRNWDVAAEVRDQIQSLAYPELQQDAVTRAIVELQRLNPSLRIALLNHNAQVLAHAPHNLLWEPSRIEVAELNRALEPINPKLPLVANTWEQRNVPEGKGVRQELFSVARLELPNESGFVYVALDFFDSSTLSRIGQFALTRAALLGFLITIGAALLLGALAFYILTKRFREVVRVLRLIGKGDYSPRIADLRQDEVGEIGAAINSMAEAVQVSRNQLEQRDNERRQLIAGITHDLRNPLTASMLKLEQLQSGFVAPEVALSRADFDTLLRNARLQKRLIEDLFELSKLEAVQRVSLDNLSLARVTTDIVERMRPVAQAASVGIAFADRDVSSFEVLADRVLIERALGNILENAIRYSPPASTITIGMSRTDQGIQVSVTDAGAGVSQDIADSIFESGVSDVNSPGAGLGLAIVARIVELHRGSLACESMPGKGTTMRVTLPFSE